jgi:hypothetical protein
MLNISVAPTEYLTTDIASLVFISVQHFRDATMKKAGDEVGKSQLPQFLSSILHNTNYASFLLLRQSYNVRFEQS